jgi:hypothetical protein
LARRVFGPDRAFDSELWQAQEDSGTNCALSTRDSMSDDPLDSKLPMGWTGARSRGFWGRR